MIVFCIVRNRCEWMRLLYVALKVIFVFLYITEFLHFKHKPKFKAQFCYNQEPFAFSEIKYFWLFIVL